MVTADIEGFFKWSIKFSYSITVFKNPLSTHDMSTKD